MAEPWSGNVRSSYEKPAERSCLSTMDAMTGHICGRIDCKRLHKNGWFSARSRAGIRNLIPGLPPEILCQLPYFTGTFDVLIGQGETGRDFGWFEGKVLEIGNRDRNRAWPVLPGPFPACSRQQERR